MVVGLATTVASVVVDKPVAGFQLYEVAPLAVNVVLVPLQMDAEDGVTVIVGAFTSIIVSNSNNICSSCANADTLSGSSKSTRTCP